MTLVDDLSRQLLVQLEEDGVVDPQRLAAYLIRRGVGKRGGRRRSRRERPECPELGAAARRFARALAVRAAEGDTEAIEQLVDVAREVDESIVAAGRGLYAAGYSWQDIGRVLGVTKQAARKRFGEGVTA